MNKKNRKKSPDMIRVERHNQRRDERIARKKQVEEAIKSKLNAPVDENYELLCDSYRRHIKKLVDDMSCLELDSLSRILWDMGFETPGLN